MHPSFPGTGITTLFCIFIVLQCLFSVLCQFASFGKIQLQDPTVISIRWVSFPKGKLARSNAKGIVMLEQ